MGPQEKEKGSLPLGGWARLSTIHKGKWDKYFPKPVKIPTDKYVEEDYENNKKWFVIINGQCIQGLLAREGKEVRVYIVTIIPELEQTPYARWPRIILDN